MTTAKRGVRTFCIPKVLGEPGRTHTCSSQREQGSAEPPRPDIQGTVRQPSPFNVPVCGPLL
ncbi:hypothetical protein I79_014173 [Cricetulus griseus]|uniref:Uncharacterized protein n=1 Tax=Cricetulus griseus TaxID=10029 RepID=G3HTE8_CRIGR|nr:hypothetical protein I79_014173 [Cricetulus griseus]